MKTIETTVIDQLKIYYVSSLKGFEETLLLLSPLPENIRAFEPIWEPLTSKCNVIAVDLPGFGKSQSRSALFSPRAMAGFVLRLLDHFKLGPVHIAGPDIGSSVALFIAQEHPDRIKSAIVGSAACVYPIQAGGILTDMIMAPDLDSLKQYSSRDIINGALANMSTYALPDDVREDYLSSYEDGRFWDTMAFLKALPADLPALRPEKINTPVQIIWGANDPLAIVANANILHESLPDSEMHILETGHYVWEDEHEKYAQLVTDWVTGGYRRQ